MDSRCRCIEHLILRPTLRLLDAESDAAVTLLLGTGLAETGFGTPQPGMHGFFAITTAQHRRAWDEYLAFRPERASLVRGLASPIAFLQDPDAELDRNPAYATAIAWIIYEADGVNPELAGTGQALAGVWREVYHPGEEPDLTIAGRYWQDIDRDAA